VVKTRNLYLTWPWNGSGTWQDRRSGRQTQLP